MDRHSAARKACPRSRMLTPPTDRPLPSPVPLSNVRSEEATAVASTDVSLASLLGDLPSNRAVCDHTP